jgi:hypothetical protein
MLLFMRARLSHGRREAAALQAFFSTLSELFIHRFSKHQQLRIKPAYAAFLCFNHSRSVRQSMSKIIYAPIFCDLSHLG